jgi:hypothetical protein
VGKGIFTLWVDDAKYKKYTDRMSIDDLPEEECKAVAREVADEILDRLRQGKTGLTAAGPFAKNEEGSACSPH